jgi:23S rRNA (cytosine1962-C5)-methyltransferase
LNKPKTVAVKLSSSGEHAIREKHPWIFSKAIEKINSDVETGDICIIFNKKSNKVSAIGLYDDNSPIKIKVIHHGGKANINEDFFRNKIEKAFTLRRPLLETNTNSYRCIFGENDGFPGLIADVYNNVLVVKLYSEIWIEFLDSIFKVLLEVTSCKTLVFRKSRSLKDSKKVVFKDGEVVYGNLNNEVIQFVEHNINFSANVIKGHKTGYFLDHRENRRLVGEMSKGKTVLDVFSYAGGFSVHALANGAKEVTSLDISKHALEIAKYNSSLNDYIGKHNIICGDAFEELNKLITDNVKFDIVVIDPPSFAKSKTETTLALKKYKQLAEIGSKLVTKNGVLVLASCSSRVSAEMFFNNIENQLRNKNFTMIDKEYHDIDHPVTFIEGFYLKCGYYKYNGLKT